MSAAAHFWQPCFGTTWRHINALSDRDVLDFSFAGSQRTNRWNVFGQPTLYLASSIDVALVEWARNLGTLKEDYRARRDLYAIGLRLSRVVDLRDEDIRLSLGLPKADSWFLDKESSRKCARAIRSDRRTHALIVPSAAFPDRPNHFNLVVFLEHVPAETSTWIASVERDGILTLDHHSDETRP